MGEYVTLKRFLVKYGWRVQIGLIQFRTGTRRKLLEYGNKCSIKGGKLFDYLAGTILLSPQEELCSTT